MREVVAYLARALVDEPDRVTVSEYRGHRGLTYEVRAAPRMSASWSAVAAGPSSRCGSW